MRMERNGKRIQCENVCVLLCLSLLKNVKQEDNTKDFIFSRTTTGIKLDMHISA